MEDDIKISKDFTVGDWKTLKRKLKIDSNYGWIKSYKVFYNRINSRFLIPIKRIKNGDLNSGEGFAISLIAIVLLESLASFSEGKIYQANSENLAPNEYSSSAKLLSDFFKSNLIFKDGFQNRKLLNRFYEHIRCGLIHEARTKGNDRINSDLSYKSEPKFYYKEDNKIILNRDRLINKLNEFIASYKKSLIHDKNDVQRKKFLMKMNEVCGIDHVWYFVYGSNLNMTQLYQRLDKLKTHDYGIVPTYINGYEFQFNKRSVDGSAKANLQSNPNEKVYGIAILLEEDKFDEFGQTFEDGYTSLDIEIYLSEENEKIVLFNGKTFISQIITASPPNEDYVKCIMDGAKEHNLPANYISKYLDVS